MKKIILAAALGIVPLTPTFGQDSEIPKPTIQDLDFLIGTWEIRAEHYDPHKPEAGIDTVEVGIRVCEYDIVHNGRARFIVCESNVKNDKGRERVFKEYIRYNPFTKAFEQVAFFGNWPANEYEKVTYDPSTRTLEIRGELLVFDLLERYEEIYIFSEDLDTFERTGLTNFTDMRMSQWNPLLNETGKKIK